MPRRIVRPYGSSISGSRAVSLVMMLAVLWVLYGWVRNPATWRWVADDGVRQEASEDLPEVSTVEAKNVEVANAEGEAKKPEEERKKPEDEKVVAGPNDKDAEEFKKLVELSKQIKDRSPLLVSEMNVYWKLMDWIRTETLETLHKRSAKGVAFSQIWEDPDRYRGKLIHLKLHVRRVLKYEADENTIGVKTVYEAWGWTDDSKSFPYVVVFPDRPEGLPLGTDVRAELEFTGYFMKVMGYTAFDVSRGAPLLVGRARLGVDSRSKKPDASMNEITSNAAVIGIAALLAFGIWSYFQSRRSRMKTAALPDSLAELDDLAAAPVFPDDEASRNPIRDI